MVRAILDADSLPVVSRAPGGEVAPTPSSGLPDDSRASKPGEDTELPRRLSWTNTLFLLVAHLLAAGGVLYLIEVRASLATLALAFLWFAFCGFSITGGYHRLFAHRSYRASLPVRLFHLLFGAASVQNSALQWASDHRRHHAREGSVQDPYDIERGFFWAHIGWVLFNEVDLEVSGVEDLQKDRWVRWQARHYLLLALVVGALVPMGIAALWGDAWGGLLVAGFLRLVVQWHSTFSVNSFAHWVGSRPYSKTTTARDSFFVAIVSLGEGYHNFHHRFPADYRNGLHPLAFDPTKWAVWSLARLGLVRDLKRTPPERIEKARAQVQASEEASGREPVQSPGTASQEAPPLADSALATDRPATS